MTDTLEDKKAQLAAKFPQLFANEGKFVPKLGIWERHAVLAYHKLGIKRSVLALAFGVNRSTVSHITSPYSKHYKAIRDTYVQLGPDEFNKQFTTDEWDRKVAEAAKHPEAEDGEKVYRAKAKDQPNKNANGAARIYQVITPLHDGPLRIDVHWVNDPHDDVLTGEPRESGWYVTSSEPGWGQTYGKSADRFTSKAALEGFLREIEGEIQ